MHRLDELHLGAELLEPRGNERGELREARAVPAPRLDGDELLERREQRLLMRARLRVHGVVRLRRGPRRVRDQGESNK